MLGYIGSGLLFMAFVPRATDYLVTLEHLTYRPDVAQAGVTGLTVVTMAAIFLMPIIVAPLLDLCSWLARRNGWSRCSMLVAMTVVAMIAYVPVCVLRPFIFLELANMLGVPGVAVSLLLGLAGMSLGIWFGCRMGETMQQLEREA